MSQSRRVFLRYGALALPGLACAGLAANASASEWRGSEASVLDAGKSDDPFADARLTCPLCVKGSACPQHPF